MLGPVGSSGLRELRGRPRMQGWLPPDSASRSRRETNEVAVPKELFQQSCG